VSLCFYPLQNQKERREDRGDSESERMGVFRREVVTFDFITKQTTKLLTIEGVVMLNYNSYGERDPSDRG
jgi:hypothetical protein